MRYVGARFQKEMRESTYRIYVTDALKAIAGGNMRYADIWSEKFLGVEETRTPEEIIDEIITKSRKIGGENNGNNVTGPDS